MASSATTTTITSINVPQLLAVALVGFLAIRWFLRPAPSDTIAGSVRSSGSRGRPIDIAKIDQVSAMFPQADRRAVAWDLSRNGQSVNATTERILSGRALDSPPPSFQPSIPPAASTISNASPASGRREANHSGQSQDLITRYGLQNRLSSKGKEAEPSEETKRSAWSSDKAARAEGLKRRREEMILAARRKLVERERDMASS